MHQQNVCLLLLLNSGHNQTLEFLGDTILQLIASDYLFRHFPDHHEGHLTVCDNLHSYYNNNIMIAVSGTVTERGAVASLATTDKTNKYSQLSATHIFTPVAIETAGIWHHQAVELVQELGRRATIITGDYRESTYLFQQLSVALQTGN